MSRLRLWILPGCLLSFLISRGSLDQFKTFSVVWIEPLSAVYKNDTTNNQSSVGRKQPYDSAAAKNNTNDDTTTSQSAAAPLIDAVQANNTIVTAYFKLATKRHTDDEYIDYLKRLFSLNDPMIIFTTPDLAHQFSEMRGQHNKTRIVTMHLNETRMALGNYSAEYWQRMPNANAHFEVYWIWNEKLEFLKKAADLNPFQSQFFAWVDAGLIRWDEYANSTLLQRIPPELKPDQMMVLNVTRLTRPRRPRLMIGAGLFGGYIPGIYRYHERFYQVLEEQAHTKGSTDLSSEQVLMYKTCIQNPGLCFTVRPEQQFGYGMAVRWGMFFMIAFLNRAMYEKMHADGLIQAEFGDYTLP